MNPINSNFNFPENFVSLKEALDQLESLPNIKNIEHSILRETPPPSDNLQKSSIEKELKFHTPGCSWSFNQEIVKKARMVLNQSLPLEDLHRKKHADQIKKYEKTLKKISSENIDHTEEANRATQPKGIIGESGIEALELRAKKTEWGRCLNIGERLGRHISEINKESPKFSEEFKVNLDPNSQIYPIVMHLLRSIKNPVAPQERISRLSFDSPRRKSSDSI